MLRSARIVGVLFVAVVSPALAQTTPSEWILNGSGSWNAAANWSGPVPNSADAQADFGQAFTGVQASISLDGAKQVRALRFDNSHRYLISSGGPRLTLGDGTAGSMNALSGSHRILAIMESAGSLQISVAAGAQLTVDALIMSAGEQIGRDGPGVLSIGVLAEADTTLVFTDGVTQLNSLGTAATSTTPAFAPSIINISGQATVVQTGDHRLKALNITYEQSGIQGYDLRGVRGPGISRLRVYSPDLEATRTALWAAIRHAVTHPGDGIYDSNQAIYPNVRVGIATVPDAFGQPHIFIRPSGRPSLAT
jgi:hypothetical protein